MKGMGSYNFFSRSTHSLFNIGSYPCLMHVLPKVWWVLWPVVRSIRENAGKKSQTLLLKPNDVADINAAKIFQTKQEKILYFILINGENC